MTSSKHRNLIIYTVSILVLILFISASQSFGGSPGGRTGSPGDGNVNCTSCHSDNATITKTNLISSDIPSSGYVPGFIYRITVSANHAGSDRIGFEITSENSIANKIGTLTLINDETTVLTNNNTAVTHTALGAKANNSSISWQFNWQAPIAGSGNVTFYLAVNATNSDLSSSGDQVYLSDYKLIEEGTTGVALIPNISDDIFVYPNPVESRITISSHKDITVDNILIVNLFGKKIRSIELNSNLNNNIMLDLNKLSSGIYFLILNIDGKRLVKRIYKL